MGQRQLPIRLFNPCGGLRSPLVECDREPRRLAADNQRGRGTPSLMALESAPLRYEFS